MSNQRFLLGYFFFNKSLNTFGYKQYLGSSQIQLVFLSRKKDSYHSTQILWFCGSIYDIYIERDRDRETERETVFLDVEKSSPPIGTSGCVIFGMHCASCWSSSVSLSRSSKLTSPSFKFFPEEKYNRRLKRTIDIRNYQE